MSGISTLLMKYEGNEDDLTLYDLRGSSFEGLDWWNGCNLPKHLPGKYQEASNVSFVGKGVVGGEQFITYKAVQAFLNLVKDRRLDISGPDVIGLLKF